MIRLIGLSILCMLLAVPTQASEKKPSSPAQTATGPVTPGEAEILWERVQESLAERNFDQAIVSLERLVNRIPTHARSLQAQRLLGELELERGQPEKALEWLGIASNNLKGQGAGASEIDLLRAQAYLLLRKGSEALLISEKLLDEADAGKIRWGIDAQIIKTRALFLLRQNKRADSSLAAARRRKLEDSLQPASATLWMEVIDLQSLEAQCKRYPSAKTLTEEQVIDQATRYSDCVIRARTQHQKATSVPTISFINAKQALAEAEASWARIRRQFESFCESPPLPPGRRSAQELKAYLSELKVALKPACTKAQTP